MDIFRLVGAPNEQRGFAEATSAGMSYNASAANAEDQLP